MCTSGSQRREGDSADFELTYLFGISKNLTDLQVRDIQMEMVKGWQYLWVLSERVTDANAKVIVPIRVRLTWRMFTPRLISQH